MLVVNWSLDKQLRLALNPQSLKTDLLPLLMFYISEILHLQLK